MPHCKSCGDYYRTNQFNQSSECEYCVDQITQFPIDAEDEIEVQHIVNPNGKVLPRFLDE